MVCQPEPVRFAFISSVAEEQDESGTPRPDRYPVDLMCRIPAVSRSGYYAWSNRQESTHAQRDAELTAKIVAINAEHGHRYGIDRIHAELAKPGEATSQRRVRRPTQGQTVMHTDRGSVHTGAAFRNLRLDQGILPSVGKTGTCFDNAAAESFDALYKKELIHLAAWRDLGHISSATFQYIEAYDNRKRIQRQLGYLSPAQYESKLANKLSLAA